MIHVWKPVDTTGADGEEIKAKLSGKVEVEIPRYVQRLKYLKDAKFKINAEGGVDGSVDNLDLMIKAIELAEKHIKTVDLTVVETNEKITEFEVMADSPFCDDALTEIGFLILNGPELGKR